MAKRKRKQAIQTARSPSNTVSNPPTNGVAKTEQYPYSYLSFGYMPRKYEQTRQIRVEDFKYYSSNDILDFLRQNHPESSFALWQFLRVANSGLEFDAKEITGDHSEEGQKVLDQILWRMNHPPNNGRFEESKGIDLITGQLLANAMMRGGVGGEDVLNSLGKLDRIQPFDPATLYFQREEGRLVPYQRQSIPGSTGYVKIDYPTVFYEPLDPATDDPYGSSPLISLIQVIVWQVTFINDLLAAVHQTGYPRMRVKLLEEIAKKNAPSHVQNDPVKYRAWMDAIKLDVQTAMKNLDPDAIPVLWDSAELDLVGKGGGQSIKVDAVIATINKSLSAALKTLSSIIGIGENTSKESYAAELKLYSRGIESVQKVIENFLEKALTLALNLEGQQGWVDVKFKTVDLRSDYQIIAEVQTYQDVVYSARDEGDIGDEERTKLIREKLGLKGKPKDWDALQEERKKSRESGTKPTRQHGSPPATQ